MIDLGELLEALASGTEQATPQPCVRRCLLHHLPLGGKDGLWCPHGHSVENGYGALSWEVYSPSVGAVVATVGGDWNVVWRVNDDKLTDEKLGGRGPSGQSRTPRRLRRAAA